MRANPARLQLYQLKNGVSWRNSWRHTGIDAGTQEALNILQAFVTTVLSQDFGWGALCGKQEIESLTRQLVYKIHPCLLSHFLSQASRYGLFNSNQYKRQVKPFLLQTVQMCLCNPVMREATRNQYKWPVMYLSIMRAPQPVWTTLKPSMELKNTYAMSHGNIPCQYQHGFGPLAFQWCSFSAT